MAGGIDIVGVPTPLLERSGIEDGVAYGTLKGVPVIGMGSGGGAVVKNGLSKPDIEVAVADIGYALISTPCIGAVSIRRWAAGAIAG